MRPRFYDSKDKEIDPKTIETLKRAKNDVVFFVENFLKNKKGEFYKLEPQQKLVLRDPHPYKALMFSRRSGKSLIMAFMMLHSALFHKNYKIFLISASGSQADEFALEFDTLIRNNPVLQNELKTDNKFSKIFKNGTRIKFNTAGSKSGQAGDSASVGAGADEIYIDEYQSISLDDLATILPIVIGQDTQVKITICGTPRSRTDAFSDVINSQKFLTTNCNTTVQMDEGRYSVHIFQLCELDENDGIVNIRLDRVKKDDLDVIKETIGPSNFRREFCLEYTDQISKPYYESLIVKASNNEKAIRFGSFKPCVAGLDYGKVRNNSVLTVAELQPQGYWLMNQFKIWPLGTEYQEITKYLTHILYEEFPFLKLMAFDKTGIGISQAEKLEAKAPYPVEGITFSQPSKIDLVENCVGKLEDQSFRIYPNKRLVREMQEYDREVTDAGRVIFQKGETDDFVDSMNLCAKAATMYELSGGTMIQSSTPKISSMGGKMLENRSNNQQNTLRSSRARVRSAW